jgi:exosortase E/protease (VPEID-CTERM system)
VRWILRGLIANLVQDPATLTIGGPKFSVFIAPECSGLEGVGLMFAFGCAWLWFFRREYRYPQAFLLVPVGMGAIWLANAVRIAALVLIGEAGAERIAAGGFHSQAGWIVFLGVALAFAAGSLRIPWLCRSARSRVRTDAVNRNATAAYLMPFLTILAAALIAQSASGGFEWLYPLRFFAAAAAIWYFRREYRGLTWSISWVAPAAGVVVFLIWMAMEKGRRVDAASPFAIGLAGLPVLARTAWLFFRTAAAVVTVPLAEELAFRAFLMRRLAAADFESVSCRSFALAPFLTSSAAFGMLHGERWLAATLAGAVYGAIFLRRGSIGDAVTAHAVTNTLLAGWVLSTGSWNLW